MYIPFIKEISYTRYSLYEMHIQVQDVFPWAHLVGGGGDQVRPLGSAAGGLLHIGGGVVYLPL